MQDMNVRRAVVSRHERNPSTVGEHCKLCGDLAMHKVEEDQMISFNADLQAKLLDPAVAVKLLRNLRHPFTAYLCCTCFVWMMGPVAREMCERVPVQPVVAA